MTEQSQPKSPPALPELPDWLCVCVLGAFVVAMLGNVLLVNPHEVLSDGRMDLAHFFIDWRNFGFGELKAGHLALWNPHCYCGAPFFGNFQSALLYPLNFLYLLAPVDIATNWTIALHVFLGGVFTFYWVRWRKVHSLGCLLAATMFMFCGPHFLQIHSGHLPNLCTLIWAPLLFLAMDRIMDEPTLGSVLLGMFTMAMAILAGHPQYVFYLGVTAGIYTVLNLWRAPRRGKIVLSLTAIVLGGICLSAVQLFTGLDESRESMRSLGMPFAFAASFSFPPENFLTLVAPWWLGDAKNVAYLGQWFITDVSLFVSVMGLALAIYGMGRETKPMRRFAITLLLITLVLAMGDNTPVFYVMYKFVPGFSLFRGTDKFLWLAALFLSLLAGIGLDRMLRRGLVSWWLVGGVAGAGILMCGLALFPISLDRWKDFLMKLQPTTMALEPVAEYFGPNLLERSSTQATRSLLAGGFTLFMAAGLLALARPRRSLACIGMLLLTAIELAWFAQTSLVSFAISPPYPPLLRNFLAHIPGDYRIQYENPNSAMSAGTLDVGGDDPSGLLRYFRYLDYLGGIDSDTAPYATRASTLDGWGVRMLRLRFAFEKNKPGYAMIKDPLPRLVMVNKFRVMTNFHDMFRVMTQNNFHAENEVILESQPDPTPQPTDEKGLARVVQSSADDLTIEANAKVPSVLLITDAYSSGWRALPLAGSSQSHYQIMPANYCLQAIPLAAGHHLLRLEYSPLGFRVGKVVSLIAWPVFLALAGWFTLKTTKPQQTTLHP